jgi:AcrR family transcriptional regulator
LGRKSRSPERKAEILEHYYQVIIEQGYANTSIAKIANHMNVQPSLIMHYFSTKENMTIELMDYFAEKYISSKITAIEEEKDLSRKLDLSFNFGLDNVEEKCPIDTMMRLVSYLSTYNEDAQKAVDALVKKYRSFGIEQLKLLYESGIILNEDSESLIDIFLTLNKGYDKFKENCNDEESLLILRENLIQILKNAMQINYNIYKGADNCE